jgi:hypothetical protein
VDSPVGKYNLDWAIIWEKTDSHSVPEGKMLYLVRETKDIEALARPQELRPNELRKVRCGARHFKGALGVSYEVVKSVIDLPVGAPCLGAILSIVPMKSSFMAVSYSSARSPNGSISSTEGLTDSL